MSLKQKIDIAIYNTNPLTSGKIEESTRGYIWEDDYRTAFTSNAAERFGAGKTAVELLEEQEESGDSPEYRYAGSD